MFKRAKVVMLSTEKASHIILNTATSKLLYFNNHSSPHNNVHKPQHLYILSDEEPKEGDVYYDTLSNKILNWTSSYKHSSFTRKLLATTEIDTLIKTPQPSEAFIKAYIEAYNSGNPIIDVDVEYEYDHSNQPIKGEVHYMEITKLKVDKNNTITIKKIKDSWTREEVVKILHQATDDTCFNPQLLDSWIKQNL